MNPSSLSYYKDADSLPITFKLDPRGIKRLGALKGRTIEKKSDEKKEPVNTSPRVITLTPRDLRNISDLTSHIPEELLITTEEFKQIKDTLKAEGVNLEAEINEELKWREFKELTRSLDLFVMGGFSHSHTTSTAKYLRAGLEIPVTSKILLTSVAGMSVNANNFVKGVRSEQYSKTYVLQPGIGASGGFPLVSTLKKESIDSQDTREAWTSHIKPYIKEDFDLCMDKEGKPGKDKLVVIYCSKDGPGMSGTHFLQTLSIKINPRDYSVLLVGANKTTEEYLCWEKLCKGYKFKSYEAIPRTENTETKSGSEILMRGLRDAEFSMATGSFSILEARSLKIPCEYLAPSHMEQLASMLKRPQESISDAFVQGQIALEELSRLPLEEYNGNLFNHECTWSHKTQAHEIGWVKYLKESKKLAESVSEEVQIGTKNTNIS